MSIKINYNDQEITLKESDFDFIRFIFSTNFMQEGKGSESPFNQKIISVFEKLDNLKVRADNNKIRHMTQDVPKTKNGFSHYRKLGWDFHIEYLKNKSTMVFCNKTCEWIVENSFSQNKQKFQFTDVVEVIRHSLDIDNKKIAKKYLLKKFENWLEKHFPKHLEKDAKNPVEK